MLVSGGLAALINNCSFTDNVAKHGSGGAVCVHKAGSAVTITGATTFTSNTAEAGHGGAVAAGPWSGVVVTGCTSVVDMTTGNGGFLAGLNASHITVVDSAVSGTSAQGFGGAISAEGCSHFVAARLTLARCSAGRGGGGLYVSNTPDMTLWSSQIEVGSVAPAAPSSSSSSVNARRRRVLLAAATGTCVLPHDAVDTSSWPYGGGVLVAGASSGAVTNTTINLSVASRSWRGLGLALRLDTSAL